MFPNSGTISKYGCHAFLPHPPPPPQRCEIKNLGLTKFAQGLVPQLCPVESPGGKRTAKRPPEVTI